MRMAVEVVQRDGLLRETERASTGLIRLHGPIGIELGHVGACQTGMGSGRGRILPDRFLVEASCPENVVPLALVQALVGEKQVVVNREVRASFVQGSPAPVLGQAPGERRYDHPGDFIL